MPEKDINMNYYIIPETIVEEFQGFQKNNFAINFTKTNKNIWVINQNCGEDIFTEINFKAFDLIELSIEDFQPTYEDKPLVNGYRLVNVIDNYNNTIDITLFKEKELLTINRKYKNGSWTDTTVFNYINEL